VKFGLVFTQDLLQGARNLVALEVSKIDCSPEKITLGVIQVRGGIFFLGKELVQTDIFIMQKFPKVSILRKLLHFWEVTAFYACLNPEFSKLSTPPHRQ